MAGFILLIIIATEICFCVFTIIKRNKRKANRIMASLFELLFFIIMLPFKSVDLGFRFKGLFIVLIIRIIIEIICYLTKRNKITDTKKPFRAVASAFVGIIVLSISMLPAFIFSSYNGMKTSGIYNVAQASVILTDENRIEEFENDDSKREVPVYFFYPADACEKSCPLVLFSHGAFGYYQSNMSTYQELASNGYVVISLDHPYHSFFTKDTDGKTITVDPDFINNVFYINEADISENDIHVISDEWLKLRNDDMNFVIDTVKLASQNEALSNAWFLNETNKDEILHILNIINCDKIGVMGHSLGGAASVSVGRMRDDISAVIDLDGTMLGEELGYEEPYPIPVLSVNNESHYIDGQKAGSYYVNTYVLENAIDSHNIYFKGSAHMNFTDLPLFSPALASLLGTGTIDARHCIVTMNEIILNYMNYYLKGEGELNLQECYE